MFVLVANVRKKDNGQHVYSIQMNEDKKIEAAPPTTYQNKVVSNRAAAASVMPSVTQKENDVNQHSLKDSDGNTLTQQQADFFKDSKVRDENGNLQVVYHGTERGGFTVFEDTDNIGYFFTSSRYTASTYSGSTYMFQPETIKTWDEAISLAGHTIVEAYTQMLGLSDEEYKALMEIAGYKVD